MARFEQDLKDYKRYAEEKDIPIRQELLHGNRERAITKIAGLYLVARNFSRRYDEGAGLGRYGPVLSALEAYPMENEADPVETVLGFTRDLARVYQREVLSAASKFLWFVWGQHIIIYDSQALATIRRDFPKLESKDYRGYCAAWKKLFDESSTEIAIECEAQGASSEIWFQQRVFDWYLWRSGR